MRHDTYNPCDSTINDVTTPSEVLDLDMKSSCRGIFLRALFPRSIIGNEMFFYVVSYVPFLVPA